MRKWSALASLLVVITAIGVYQASAIGTDQVTDCQAVIRTASAHIEAARLKTIGSDPFVLIPDPGTGKWAFVSRGWAKIYGINTPYNLPEDSWLVVTPNGQTPFGFSSGILNYYRYDTLEPLTSSTQNEASSNASGPWVVTTRDGSNPTDGDGSIWVMVEYSIQPPCQQVSEPSNVAPSPVASDTSDTVAPVEPQPVTVEQTAGPLGPTGPQS